MKKLCASILAFSILFSLTACTSSPVPTEPQPSVTEPILSEPTDTLPTEPPEQAPMYSISLPVIQEQTDHEDDSVLFRLTYQDMTLILPEPDVAEKIIVHYLNGLDAVIKEGQSICSAAEDAYQGQSQWQAYSSTNLYNVKRIDGNVLSLHGTYSSYSGAIHPTHITQSSNYNLITGDALTLDEILAEGANIDQVYQLLVTQLHTTQNEKPLYPDFEEIVKDLLGYGDFDNWYFNTEGLCFCFSPYDIAPYASGIVEATIPYSQLQGILLDAYFPMEWAYKGNVVSELFDSEQMNNFSQISELTLHPEGEKLLLHSANTAVSNVVIEYGSVSQEENGQFLPWATVFACASLTPGDAVVIQAILSDVEPVLRISYQSGNQIIVKYIFQNGMDGTIELIDL